MRVTLGLGSTPQAPSCPEDASCGHACPVPATGGGAGRVVFPLRPHRSCQAQAAGVPDGSASPVARMRLCREWRHVSFIPQGVPEDLLFFHEHLRKGGGLVRVDQSLLLYRYHPGAATHSILEYTQVRGARPGGVSGADTGDPVRSRGRKPGSVGGTGLAAPREGRCPRSTGQHFPRIKANCLCSLF